MTKNLIFFNHNTADGTNCSYKINNVFTGNKTDVSVEFCVVWFYGQLALADWQPDKHLHWLVQHPQVGLNSQTMHFIYEYIKIYFVSIGY